MAQNSYKNIKKYAAFVFMVFTVLSGSSEAIDSDSFIKLGRKAFIDILISNKLFAQDAKLLTSQSRIKIRENNNSAIREFVDADASASSIINIYVYILLLILLIFYMNDLILKNNIWKSAVF